MLAISHNRRRSFFPQDVNPYTRIVPQSDENNRDPVLGARAPKDVVREVWGCLNSDTVFPNQMRLIRFVARCYSWSFDDAKHHVIIHLGVSPNLLHIRDLTKDAIAWQISQIVYNAVIDLPRDAVDRWFVEATSQATGQLLQRLTPARLSGRSVETIFRDSADVWLEETSAYSSVTDISMHHAYQRIIGLGEPAVPLILREMQSEPGHWFWALRSITGCDPVPEEHRGDIASMSADWIRWGQSKGYIGGE